MKGKLSPELQKVLHRHGSAGQVKHINRHFCENVNKMKEKNQKNRNLANFCS